MYIFLTYFHKAIHTLGVCIALVYLTSCQKTEITPQTVAIEGGVPEVTVSNFYNRFPDNQTVVWTQMAGQAWFVSFTTKNIKLGAFWDNNGHIMSNGTLIRAADLPTTLFQNLQTNVPSGKILNAVKIYQNPDNNLVTDGYMTAVQKGNTIYCVRFNNAGNFINVTPRLK